MEETQKLDLVVFAFHEFCFPFFGSFIRFPLHKIQASGPFSFLSALMQRQKPASTPLLFCAEKSSEPSSGSSFLPSCTKEAALAVFCKPLELEGSTCKWEEGS